MLGMDKTATEDLLCKLQDNGYLFPQFELYKENNQLCILGKGGFSSVYEMFDKGNPLKHYAMKVIGFERHTVTSEEFKRTTLLQRNLGEQTTYIVRILDTLELRIHLDGEGNPIDIQIPKGENWDEEGLLLQFILMEKLDNIIDKDRFRKATLKRKELSDEEEVLNFTIQIGQAIMIAHKNKVLHRDIKLENIFWDESDKKYKLGDFGIAKYVENGNADTIVYTDGYGAPEIEHRLYDSYGDTADIYSYGITLYLLLNNLRFPGSEGYYVNMVQYSPDYVFPAPLNSSNELTRIVRKMCSYRKEERYQTMAEVLTDLEKLLGLNEQQDNDDYMDLLELTTESYREEKEERSDDEENSETLSRAQRKQRKRATDAYYNKSSVWYLFGLSMLFALVMKGMQADTSVLSNWKFWVLLIAVLVESILQRLKEFHIVFGIMIFAYGVYSAITIGFTVPFFILFLCVAIGVPILTTAGALGTVAWMLLSLTEKLSWLNFIGKHDLSWIGIVIIMIVVNRLMILRLEMEKTTYRKAIAWAFIYDKLALTMIVTGVVLLILKHLELIAIPDAVRHIHLIRTGIIVFIINMIEYWWYGEPDETPNVTDVEKVSNETEEEDDVSMGE